MSHHAQQLFNFEKKCFIFKKESSKKEIFARCTYIKLDKDYPYRGAGSGLRMVAR